MSESDFPSNDLVLDIFKVISSHLNINIFAVDLNGDYIYRNEKLKNIMGNIARMEDIDPDAWQSCKQVISGEKATVIEEEYEGVWYLSVKSPFYKNKKIAGLIGIAIDITDRKIAEQLRVEKEAAEEKVESIQLIAAAIAHEIRTPLRSIDAGIQGVQHYLPDLVKTYETAKQANLDIPYIAPADCKVLGNSLKETENETRAVFNVIDMLLVKADLSQIKKTEFKKYSVMQCLHESLDRYHFDIDERELVHLNEDNDFEFFGDPLLVSHVFFNLIQNALYFIKAASKGEINIWIEQNDEFNILHFKDTGAGIPVRSLPHVFDKFYTTTKHGTGVGLAFCKLVMESMDGSIKCYSNEGAFTEFVLKFPRLENA